MSQMSVSEAIVKRHSVRAFLPKPVPKTVVEQVINTAAHAPSGSNIQPWKIHVFTGSALQQGIQALGQRLMSGEQDQPEFPTYPPKMGEPFRSRRDACAERMYGALGIERDDRQGRMMQVMKNYQFFNAPVGIIITIEKSMGESQCIDAGILLQSLMLAAEEQGLASCPQVAWSAIPNGVRSAFGISEDEKIVVGLSLGYADPDASVNQFRQPRVELTELVSLNGFDA